jgi:uncharacterized repeat protein (TIGR01451 family)
METIKSILKPSRSQQVQNRLLRYIMVSFYLTILSSSSFGQTVPGCNYNAGSFSMILEGHTKGIGFTSRLVLTDSSGTIKYVTDSNSTLFQNVTAGNYLAYGLTYENAVYIPNLTVGKNIKLISICYKTVVVPICVCDCNNSDGNLNTVLSDSLVGKIRNYALTDGKGTILLVKTIPSFPNNAEGIYNIIPVVYDIDTYPQNLEIGKNILSVRGDNALLEEPTGFVVCLPKSPSLSIVKKAPTMAFTGDIFNYTLDITNLGSISTVGSIIITDTLAQGLSFHSSRGDSTQNWLCQSNTIITNNIVRNVVRCQSMTTLMPNTIHNIIISVVAQRTGVFLNQAFIEGGGSEDISPSNIVQTVIKDNNNCKIICVPITISKVRKNK